MISWIVGHPEQLCKLPIKIEDGISISLQEVGIFCTIFLNFILMPAHLSCSLLHENQIKSLQRVTSVNLDQCVNVQHVNLLIICAIIGPTRRHFFVLIQNSCQTLIIKIRVRVTSSYSFPGVMLYKSTLL